MKEREIYRTINDEEIEGDPVDDGFAFYFVLLIVIPIVAAWYFC